MAALRSRRLESVFGTPLEQLSAEHVRRLVENGAAEEFDVDFKQTLYGRSDSDKRALAGDVAALANTAGGVILIGIAEDDQARATSADGVELSDAETARMRQVVAASVSPMPDFDILPIREANLPDENDDPLTDEADSAATRGFYVIAVPRSPNAPHAVLVNQALRFPKRNGATIRSLSEPEVASAYRDRTAGMERQAQRLDVVEMEAIERLDRSAHPWLVVSLVPDLPGEVSITTDSFRQFEQQMMGVAAWLVVRSPVQVMRTSVGSRRFIADGGRETALADWVSIELHADGSGAYGLPLYDMNEHARERAKVPVDVHQLADDETVVAAILSGLLRLGGHARDRAAAGGNAIVRARIAPASTVDALEIGYSRLHGLPHSRGSVAVKGRRSTERDSGDAR